MIIDDGAPVNTEAAGGSRYSAGKPGGWSYIPMYGLRLISAVAVDGGKKYAPQDWRNGQSFSTLWDCFMRHVLEAQERGITARCPESGHLHLAHAAWNLLALLTFIAVGRDPELNDIDIWRGVTAAMKREAERLAEYRGISFREALLEVKRAA